MSNAFPALLADPDGFAAIAAAVGQGVPWRRSLFLALGARREGLPAGERLLSELRQSPVAPTPAEVSAIIQGYVREQDFQSAYRLFLFSLSEEERKYSGYIYNPGFAPVALELPFDWQVLARPGVEVTLPSQSSDRSQQGARVRFLNAPLRDAGLLQSLLLPPGAYRISTTVSGSSLKLPKGLFFSVSCRGGARAGTPGIARRLVRQSQDFPGLRCPRASRLRPADHASQDGNDRRELSLPLPGRRLPYMKSASRK